MENLPDGQTTSWTNPNSGNSGSVTPVSAYTPSGNNFCREYQTEVTVEGKTQSAYGTACRRPDGTWEIVG